MQNFKKTLFSFAFVALAISLSAQVSIGVRAGATFPNFSVEQGSTNFSFDANLGLTAAAIFEIGISDVFAIQPEIAFVQKGAKSEVQDYFGGGNTESKIRLNHIEVPVLAKVKFGSETVKAYVAAGPSFGYAISGSTKEDGEKETFEDEDWEDYKRFEIGSNVGGGVGLSLAGGGLAFLDLRYMYTLNNLSDAEEISIRHKGFIVSVGLLKPISE